ncbi:MAG: hypothetical protein IKL33_03780, partial [Alphaproteobacteria bacterium]|nr:hypothetical protein [Alphaproteobacteria bacterium]
MAEEQKQDNYVVLARKYRPQNFNELLGQDALVQTLTNAIKNNRLHHAYILTGIRGVGKTTTARIIAKALNCNGKDGHGGATINPCGICENCRSAFPPACSIFSLADSEKATALTVSFLVTVPLDS